MLENMLTFETTWFDEEEMQIDLFLKSKNQNQNQKLVCLFRELKVDFYLEFKIRFIHNL